MTAWTFGHLTAYHCRACGRAQPDHPAAHPAPDSPCRCIHCGAASQMQGEHLPQFDHTAVELEWWDS
jgi:hypothetical protein